jgi:hypothetical protein
MMQKERKKHKLEVLKSAIYTSDASLQASLICHWL